MKIASSVLDLWLDASLGPHDSNELQKVFLQSTYESEENEVLFVKIGTKFLDLRLDISFRAK